MKNLKIKQVQEAIKKNRNNLIVMIVFLVIGLILIGFYYYFNNLPLKDSISFHDVIVDGKIETGLNVKIEVSEIPYAFAEYSSEITSDKYYFLMDKSYMYIGFLDHDTYKKLNTENIYEKPIVVEGITKKIPDDVIKLAIEVYNERAGEEILNDGNYKLYIGELFLDTTDKVNNYNIILLIGSISILVGLLMGFIYIKQLSQIKKVISRYTDNEWNLIEKEMTDKIIINNPKLNLYLTENYIIDIHHGLNVINYSDIVWIYPYQLKQYGIITNQNIVVYTNDGKKHLIAYFNKFSKKNKILFDDVTNLILAKNKKVLCGYTKENRQEIKDLYGIK